MAQEFSNEPQKDKKPVGLIVIIILALIAGSALAYFYYFKEDTTPASSDQSGGTAGTFCSAASECQHDCDISGCLENQEATSECVESKCECGCREKALEN